MDKTEFYRRLDIDSSDEFKYYENLSALLEDDAFIEENLIRDLLKDVDKDVLEEHFDSYFDGFLKNLPDDETELYITVESVKRMMEGLISQDMDPDAISALASEIARFRKWYVLDLNVYDRRSRVDISMRDARFNVLAAGLLGETVDYDFRAALDYDIEGYSIRFSDMIADED